MRLPKIAQWLGLVFLLALFVYFFAASWRKWPDPLVDFGRELYVPWRLSQGALLYRDVEEAYGPLSQYFNAMLFTVFQPGMMVLVTANLIIFAAILALFFLLCRRAWGFAGALAATATFIAVFGFSQLVRIANYNYATPYSHEATHGMLISLAMVYVLSGWIEEPTPFRTFLAGLLYGFCFVLKPEFILSGAALIIVSAVLCWRYHKLPSWRSVLLGLVGTALPTLAFTSYFSVFVPVKEALVMSAGAYREIIAANAGDYSTGLQGDFSGMSEAGNNLKQHLIATLVAFLVIGAIALVGWLGRKLPPNRVTIGLAVVFTGAVGAIASTAVHWREIGRCLLGLLVVYALVRFIVSLRSVPGNRRKIITATLLAVLGTALMARMFLNGRIYHYGFFQAAIAGSIVPAVLLSELPEWLRLAARERVLVVTAVLALLVPGVVNIAQDSQQLLRLKTDSIGEGIDRFYTFPPQLDGTGELVEGTTTSLKQDARIKSLVVLPEGAIINYLARIPSSVRYYYFFPSNSEMAGELEANPPDRVVLISRDLRAHGIDRYGEAPGKGREILEWLTRDYQLHAYGGDDPLDVGGYGAAIYKRKTAQ